MNIMYLGDRCPLIHDRAIHPGLFVDEENVLYPSVTHFLVYQKAKLFHHEITQMVVLREVDMKRVVAMGRAIPNFDQRIWDSHKISLAFRGNYLRFSQRPRDYFLLRDLIEADNKLLRASKDPVWGVGLTVENLEAGRQWCGRNLEGMVLHQVYSYIQFGGGKFIRGLDTDDIK